MYIYVCLQLTNLTFPNLHYSKPQRYASAFCSPGFQTHRPNRYFSSP
ncbi:unnamed protein product [Diplocarpon coronariae]